MTVSPVISQTNYIINKDTVVGYSKQDNRKIAIIFLKGDSCQSISNEKDSIINTYKHQVNDYMNLYSTLQDKNFLIQSDRDNINMKLNKSLSDNKSLTTSKNLWRLGTIGTLIVLAIKLL